MAIAPDNRRLVRKSEITPFIAEAVAADETVSLAAETAVSGAAAGLDLIQRHDAGAPRVFSDQDVLIAFTDARGNATYLAVDAKDGGPTTHAAGLIASRMTPELLPEETQTSLVEGVMNQAGIQVFDQEGILVAFTDEKGRGTWLTARESDGGPTDYWVQHIGSRLILPDGSISEQKLTNELKAAVNEPTRYHEDLVEVGGDSVILHDGVTGERRTYEVGGNPRDARVTADRHVMFTNDSGLRHISPGSNSDDPAFPVWDWAAFGDSLTKAGGPNSLPPEQAYPMVLQGLLQQDRPGTLVHMGGIASQTAGEIAVRQGGIVLNLMPVGGSIPASGVVDVQYTPQIDHRVAMAVFNVPGTLAGVHGILSKVAGSSSLNFTRDVDGTAISLVEAQPFIVDEAQANKYRGQLLWPGRNNVGFPNSPPGSGTVVEAVLRSAQTMIDSIPVYARRFILMGTTNAWSESAGTSQHAEVLAINEAEERLYGNVEDGGNYWNVRRYLIEDGLADAGITPTADDLAKIAADAPPPSLMSDSVHFNAIAYNLIANRLYEIISSKGWV